MPGINAKAVLFACLLLPGCAMNPQQLRQRLDECDEYRFDALVYTRNDGAVTRVLCVPMDDEVDHRVDQPQWFQRMLQRVLKRQTHAQQDTRAEAQQ